MVGPGGLCSSGIAVVPCGGGKTAIGIGILAKAGGTCLVLCNNSTSVRQWEEERVEGKANVFAVRLHSVDDPTPQHDEVLLLAADSRRDKFAWIDAIHRARELPPCSLDRVITMLARERVGGIDPNILGVLHGDPTQDGSHHGAHLAARYTEPSEASEATAASRRPQRSSQPDSAGGLVERWMPGFVKNL